MVAFAAVCEQNVVVVCPALFVDANEEVAFVIDSAVKFFEQSFALQSAKFSNKKFQERAGVCLFGEFEGVDVDDAFVKANAFFRFNCKFFFFEVKRRERSKSCFEKVAVFFWFGKDRNNDVMCPFHGAKRKE